MALLLIGCGGGARRSARATDLTPTGVAGRLATGITEQTPALLAPRGSGVAVPPAFRGGRDALQALRPSVVRMFVTWDSVQPVTEEPIRWGAPQAGCGRLGTPCAPYAGVLDQLRAIHAMQVGRRDAPQVVVTFYAAPAWATGGPSGCEKPGAKPSAVSDAALPAYGAMVASLARLARREGVDLRWWSPWNEPNSGLFLSPQRAGCSAASPTLSPRTYARLARTMRSALAGVPGVHRLVLGELSSSPTPRPRLTAAAEWVAALPKDVACASDVWALHQYVGDRDVMASLLRAIDRHACRLAARVWITETGAGGPRPGRPRGTDAASLRAQCRAMDALLVSWWRDPRVDVAIQYTFREDTFFPTGLEDAAMTRLYKPLYDLWHAWGDRAARAPAPTPPRSCTG